MARSLKHVGQIINTQKRVVVVFREIPDEPNSCLVVDTDALVDWMHQDVINAVESPGAQASANFYDYANRAMFTDGTNMLQGLHRRNLLMKQPTSNIMMTPDRTNKIRLDELNTLIREQTGDAPVVKPDDSQMQMANKQVDNKPATQPITQSVQAPSDGVISDTDIARGMLTQAEQFEAEAKRLREEAYEMAPETKPKRGRKPKNKETA